MTSSEGDAFGGAEPSNIVKSKKHFIKNAVVLRRSEKLYEILVLRGIAAALLPNKYASMAVPLVFRVNVDIRVVSSLHRELTGTGNDASLTSVLGAISPAVGVNEDVLVA